MFNHELFAPILQIFEGREDEIISSAEVDHVISNDRQFPDISSMEIQEAVQQLLVLGELTLVWKQQHARLILSRSIEPEAHIELPQQDFVWRTYIAINYEKRYHTGCFSSRSGAEDYLYHVAGEAVDELERVPGINCVYSTETGGFEGYGTHTVVLRCEPISDRRELTDDSATKAEIQRTEKLSDETRLLFYHTIEDVLCGTASIDEMLHQKSTDVDRSNVVQLSTEILDAVEECSAVTNWKDRAEIQQQLRKHIKLRLYKFDYDISASERNEITTRVIQLAREVC